MGEATMIRVLLVDNQVIFRQGLRVALSQSADIEIVGEAGVGWEALSLVKALAPDVVILDWRVLSPDGFDLTSHIKRHHPGVALVTLGPDDDEALFRAIKAGAAVYYPKDVAPEELIKAIMRTAKGEYPINESLVERPKVASRVLKQFQDLSLLGREVEPLLSPLSPRETEVLEHIAEGNSNKAIAHALGISNQTVKNHITSILRKLMANDRTHAVVLALRRGIISVNEQKIAS
jgi:DNA-binding NarL/FixJ family response regulator